MPLPLLVAALLIAPSAPAQAALGAGVASIADDSQRLGASRSMPRLSAGGQVHVLRLGDGSTIRQFVGVDGLVYAVAWNSRSKPRLDQLLGLHFPACEQAGRAAMQQRGGAIHAARVQQGDLVMESTAHLNAHVGRAYLQSRLPTGLNLDALR